MRGMKRLHRLGLVVGRSGLYSKASGKKWVTPPTKQTPPLKLKK